MTKEHKDTATTLFLAWGVPPERIRQALAVAAGELEYNAAAPAQVLGRAVKPKEAAKALDVSRKTVQRLVSAGKLRAVYSGSGDKRRMVGVTVASLNAYLEGTDGKGAL